MERAFQDDVCAESATKVDRRTAYSISQVPTEDQASTSVPLKIKVRSPTSSAYASPDGTTGSLHSTVPE
jgi:hypothetical protein